MKRNDGAARRQADRLAKQNPTFSRAHAAINTPSGALPDRQMHRSVSGELVTRAKSNPDGFYSELGDKPGWVGRTEQGHTTSYIGGGVEFAHEDRAQNRSEGAKFERRGVVLNKDSVVIDGHRWEKRTALLHEARGLHPRGTVETALAVRQVTTDTSPQHTSQHEVAPTTASQAAPGHGTSISNTASPQAKDSSATSPSARTDAATTDTAKASVASTSQTSSTTSRGPNGGNQGGRS
jgi:hypothetical protein